MKTKEITESSEREEVEAVSRKVKVETVNNKLHELTEEELAQVSGGAYNNGLIEYTGSGDYTYPGYPKEYYTGSH